MCYAIHDGCLEMGVRVLVAGVSLLMVSLILSFMMAIPEVSVFRDCREHSVRAFNILFIYWGNYTVFGGMSNLSLSIVSSEETLLNITYGVSFGESNNVVVLSEFTYFIYNATYFYVYVIPYRDTKLLICLNALITHQRSYLLLPTLISWVSGITITAYAAYTHVEQVFRKSLKKEKR